MGIFDNAKNVSINGVSIQSMKTSDGKWIYGGELRTRTTGVNVTIEVVIMGQPVTNQSVDIYLNGVKKTTLTTDSNGKCSIGKMELTGINLNTNPLVTYQYTAQTYIQSLGRVYSDTGSFKWYN